MNPVLGRKVVERQQLLDVVADLGDRLRKLRTIGRLELFDRVAGVGLVLGVPDLGERAFFAPGCADFGSAPRTFDILWNQQRCSRVSGNTSRNAPQNPSAPSSAASTGARMPRRRQSRNRSAHDSAASR